jgi:pSer/pThr/pTyr-binding forkhead associated (FHA) protein
VVKREHKKEQESPYATPAPVTRVPKNSPADARAVLVGPAGRFTVLSGSDLRCGRDGSRCAAVIANPQVSGLHATFRLEGDTLLVRDEGSASGTRIDDMLLEPGKWQPVEDGSEVRLGPEQLRVSREKV